ncbi:MAG TPA: glycosyltransferase family A protein [Phenylobacterium sp.]|uniref:glycosyltransferase family 2 protein n=1 Tax=Phenylobacterium sp. TaxID=1871053 RepID=UPI002B49827A|nr:glycosyltransferase family A protein [Phenylobacterium sp.]HKR88927.1 glycosyltransferase family A protein [Phenylobacterium sp.]
MPHVTVAIPAYKPAHLGQAIASVLAQTFTDFELLISDDCPNGAAREVVARFGDPRIRLIQGPRQGLVANSVHLWENAAADVLKFVYDDDFLMPFAVADLLGLLEQNPHVAFVFCARQVVDADGRILPSNATIPPGPPTLFSSEVLVEALVGEIANPVGEPTSILFRRSTFDGPQCLSRYCGAPVRHNIDVAFYLNAAERGPCVGTPAVGAAFRRHPQQASSLTGAGSFAYGVAEWELFLRGAVSRGMAAPAAALRGLERLELHYRNHRGRFPELEGLLGGLPGLRERLQNGARHLLDEAFLQRLAGVEAAIGRPRAPV